MHTHTHTHTHARILSVSTLHIQTQGLCGGARTCKHTCAYAHTLLIKRPPTSHAVVASEKGVVVGRLTFREDGDHIDCRRMGVGGKAIPPNIDKVRSTAIALTALSNRCAHHAERQALASLGYRNGRAAPGRATAARRAMHVNWLLSHPGAHKQGPTGPRQQALAAPTPAPLALTNRHLASSCPTHAVAGALTQIRLRNSCQRIQLPRPPPHTT